MVNCPLCYRGLGDRKTLSCHITRSHPGLSPLEKERLIAYSLFSEKDIEDTISRYIDEEFPICRIPIDIRLYIELLGLKRSHSEEKKTKGYKERVSKTLRERYGSDVDNISQIPEVKEKIRSAATKNYPLQKDAMLQGGLRFRSDPNNVKSLVSKIEETCLVRYGVRNFGQGEEAKKKAAESAKKFVDGLSYEEKLQRTSAARKAVCHRGGYSSKPEKRVRKCLKFLGIEAQYNLHLWDYNFDIVWDNKIIEVQGDMWHANPSKYGPEDVIMGKLLVKDIWEKDKRKREMAISQGFEFFEIWEDTIKSCKTDEELSELLKQITGFNHVHD